ncbi:Spy0128 family protein [Bifidobacterium adolescentis]|uniref:VWA domain-containing protein n=1 Tax=Bifidobacterium adolescentis TaxID=1680 RepID=A0A6I6QX73_BIFAD|nr:FctA domain-containing protein [Bifidobacterium adolescentis]QHB61881.1 VWA domain-containing protein [Bifidobacterium adolescentis]
MRRVHESEAKPKGNFAKRIVAAVAAVAMLGGMGYATTSAALADDVNATVEQQNGINIGLHDYDRNSINNNHALHFMSGGNEAGYNRYVQDGRGAYAGIVKPLLTNDYPTMADGNESLNYLFGGASDKAVTNYTPDGGLLTSDGQGNYSFDAASKYAKYNHNSNRFELTNQTQSGNRDPLFTPFGNDSDDNRYSFGMNLRADFYMPKDGKVNNQNMVFDFTGDDDVWVFIDDVLVLDLGGIHQALGGSIDFAADKIKYDKVQSHGDTPAATITEAFRKAGKKWDSKAYTTHHLSFFYLERGDGGSNCKISFNLPVKPSKAIDIEKETLGTIDANKQFQFQLFVDGSKDPYQGEYSVYNAHTNQVVNPDASTENNGVIKLAGGQFARVQADNFTDDTKYTVRELNSSDYTVSANGSPMTQQGSDNNAYAETGSFTVGKTSHVTIVNSNVKPSNNKSIVKTNGGEGDEYTLHLTASGDSTSSTVTTATPADIVLVMDKSDSMNSDNRDTNARNAAIALANKLLTAQNSALPEAQRVRMAVVTFSKSALLKQEFTTFSSKIGDAVSQKPGGGTNWEAALEQANNLRGRPGVKKHIIFLSDGNPTYRTSSYSGCYSYSFLWGNTAHPEYTTKADCETNGYSWGKNPDGSSGGVYGAGGSDEYGFNYAAALAEAKNRGDAALYVVKTAADANKMDDLASEADAVNGVEFDGTNPANLTKAFDQIYSSITSSAKIKVFSITDTLSQWVDPVDFAGVADGADITQYVTVKNGNKVLTNEYTATYGVDQSGNRTVTVTFNGTDGIVAEKADSIDVSFKVKPSDAAYATYAGNQQYQNAGEPNTGTASAGQQGFYSNVDARLNYCVLTEVNRTTSCAPTEVEYPHPVVQVKLGKIKIVKQWSDGASKHDDGSVTVQLQRKKSGDSNAQLEDVGGVITLNKGNGWQTTVDNLVPGYTYSVAEISGDDRYDVSYTGNNVDLTKQMVWSSNADAGTLNATITNTLKTVALENAISVKKDLAGREWKTSDTFDFTLAAKGNAPLPDKCEADQPCTVKVNSDSGSHTASFGNITYNAGDASYTYYVTEVKGSIASLHYSQAKYEVVVTVAKDSNGEWKASVKSVTKVLDDNGAAVPESQSAATEPVTFTNRYVAVSALPLTGGATGRQWLLVGGVIGGLAVLLIGAAEIWNNKKRLV